MNYFAHPQALIEPGATIGKDSRVWAYAHVLSGARIGAGCNICDHVFIENDVIVGDRVTIKCGVQLWDGVHLEDDVFVGPNATFTNDPFPRSRRKPVAFSRTLIRQGATIGANATILPGITIERNAMIGAGAVVTANVPANAIVVGNPGAITGYVGSERSRTAVAEVTTGDDPMQDLGVGGASLIRLPEFQDMRGSLIVAELGKGLPFAPKRCFFVYGVASRKVRGEHAHKSLHQFLICAAGQLSVAVDDGRTRAEVRLESLGHGLHIPPRVWATEYKFSADAVLMVLASDRYDGADYIRDYEEYLKFVGVKG